MEKDALNKDIIIGEQYAWTNDHNGFTTVKIGVVTKVTEKGYISLKDVVATGKMFKGDLKSVKHSGRATVRPIKLFKI